MTSFVGSAVTLGTVVLGGYVIYKALSYEYGDPVSNAHQKFRTTTNYYSDDQLTEDVHAELALSGQFNIMQLDKNLYNIR